MKRSGRFRIRVALILALPVVACHQAPPASSPAAASVGGGSGKASAQPSSTRTSTPAGSMLRTGSTPARSFTAMLQDLNAQDQARVREWYRLIDAPPMDNASPAQVEWMQARGYPMPADVIRAQSLSDGELKAAADTGGPTATALYIARRLAEYSEHSSAGMESYAISQVRVVVDTTLPMHHEIATGSPFAGYLYAARQRLLTPNDDEAIASAQLAGLVWASRFGDTRATLLLNAPNVQAVAAPNAASAMGLMLMQALHANPNLFTTSVVPIPEKDD